jgi:hypothetical protein
MPTCQALAVHAHTRDLALRWPRWEEDRGQSAAWKGTSRVQGIVRIGALSPHAASSFARCQSWAAGCAGAAALAFPHPSQGWHDRPENFGDAGRRVEWIRREEAPRFSHSTSGGRVPGRGLPSEEVCSGRSQFPVARRAGVRCGGFLSRTASLLRKLPSCQSVVARGMRHWAFLLQELGGRCDPLLPRRGQGNPSVRALSCIRKRLDVSVWGGGGVSRPNWGVARRPGSPAQYRGYPGMPALEEVWPR